MTDDAAISTLLKRLERGEVSPEDLDLLVRLIREGTWRLVLVPGPRAVAAGGDIRGSLIVTGDGNEININLQLAEQIRERLRKGWFLAHPYALPKGFTGRAREQAELDAWLTQDPEHPVFVLRALGGFGKSALAWHWLHHRVDPEAWPWVVWWSFYDKPDFGAFLEETLAYLGEAEPARLPPRAQVQRLFDHLQNQPVLLVLDGFERALRAYGSMSAAYQGDEASENARNRECTDLYATDFLRSVGATLGIRGKVFLTTRLRPRALEDHYGGDLLAGVKERELEGLSPEDAVAYLRGRGIRGRRDELQARAEDYGYHPLSLRLLAGYVRRHRHYPNNIRAAEDLDLTGDLVARRHHILKVAYESLSTAAQKTLSTLACFRSSVTCTDLIAAVPERERSILDRALQEIEDWGLVHWDREANRYDLHPIVRRYAYDRLTKTERAITHERLASYFTTIDPPYKITRLADLSPVIERYHHLTRSGRFDAAQRLFADRLFEALYYQFGTYSLITELLQELFMDGIDQPPTLSDEGA